MSNKLRNPFKIRASEKIDSEAGFLRLFSPLVLESLNEKFQSGKLWDNVLYIHSSPGAGKSSLIRVFEPSTLKILINSKSSPDFKELFNSLKRIDVINNDKIEVLSVSMQCTRNYEILEELNISPAQKSRLFFSLLNSRIAIATLRSACVMINKRFPEDLEEIVFNYNNSDNFFKSLNLPCTGKELYDWASTIERNIYKAIDSFLPLEDNEIEGHDELFSLITLTPSNILYNATPICTKILFVLDDAHKLSTDQRKRLKKYLAEKRGDFTIWISERLEALESIENLGSSLERDYNEINLEDFWRKHPAKFEKIVRSISEKRANISTEDVSSFQNYLSDNFNEERNKESLKNFTSSKLEYFNQISTYSNKFDEWIDYITNLQISDFERAQAVSELEILIHRNIGKQQLSFEFPLTVEELKHKNSHDVGVAANLFLSTKMKLPYYFGFNTLAKSSSSNIEQFLTFSGGLFEEMISKKISGEDLVLTDAEQHDVLKEIATQKWKELRRIIPFQEQVINFLTAIGEFSKKETFKPNAPYSPGVNGFAIKPNKEPKLINNTEHWTDDLVYESLINVLSTCVAYNLLEVQSTNQGKKDQSWDVYYLNRWLCILFDLPLSYGGWRHKSPDELTKWLK
ncbi:hypothetical protein [Flavobacterium sp.]|uniref:ORC-CDC6 family AAA ATPase n=1 Tax=Flavobacterium sp. TaxID=239 RepID=UPI00260578B8|nr:hypothetical protein [Flavobacterium sp.]MDD2986136.1 hypothetical protein [Flavobacterium sp.]